MRLIRKPALLLSLTFLAAVPTGATAADPAAGYPNRPVRFVVSQTPGSSIDAMSRIVATKLSQLLGKQLVVDNRTGAGGTIGGAIVANAEPDGYTLFAAATASQVIGPQLYKKLVTYDPFRDFAPVSLFAMTQNILVVNPNTPFKTVKDLVDYAKANPGKLNWSNAGTGFQSHLAGVLFTHMAKIEVLHVPYKGAGASLGAAISGESQVTIVPAPSVMGHVRAGRLRALAMGGEKRSPLAPEIPTIMESGVPGYTSRGWAGLIVPAKTPQPVQAKLLKTLHAAINDPATNKSLQKIGAEPLTSTPQEFAALIKSDWDSFGNAIRVSGIKTN
ncbi:MAG TPA: tripartite tricarboxylate transporter substrate-binding protein [Burkholderiales bacterium]|nr:tripartite tricarboxylate transporter substrate-binding protein [Burkholderiales bacterium]